VIKSQAQSQFFVQGACDPSHCPVVVSAVVVVRALITFAGVLTMEITDHTAIRLHLAVRNYDGLIMLGYVAFAIVAIAVLYFASSGPGVTEAELAIASVLP
jgi:hypothetical protein